jgi:hypothetical protein
MVLAEDCVVQGRAEEATMKDDTKVTAVQVRDYFATRALGLRWYDYEQMQEIRDLRQSTTAIGYLPTRLVLLLIEDVKKGGTGRKTFHRKPSQKPTLH